MKLYRFSSWSSHSISNSKIINILTIWYGEDMVNNHIMFAFSKKKFHRNVVNLHIFTDRPGIIIGYKGRDIYSLRDVLKSEGISNVYVHDCDKNS